MILQISQGPQNMTRENTREGREGEQNPKEALVEVLVGNSVSHRAQGRVMFHRCAPREAPVTAPLGTC